VGPEPSQHKHTFSGVAARSLLGLLPIASEWGVQYKSANLHGESPTPALKCHRVEGHMQLHLIQVW
jgi:hypothetical protein